MLQITTLKELVWHSTMSTHTNYKGCGCCYTATSVKLEGDKLIRVESIVKVDEPESETEEIMAIVAILKGNKE